jgi:hypothetical protein
MTMTTALRWRILVLQMGLVLILGFVAGFAFWAASFTHSTVTEQLSAQQIVFPTAGSAEIKALPAQDQAAMLQYAGQTMTTGDQAETYADHFLKVHLSKMPTYAAASSLAAANPTNASDQNLVATVFKGTTLRSMLLNAYGWWTVGTYAFYAAIGLAVAAFAVMLTFLFEVYQWVAGNRTARVVTTAPPAAFGGQPAVGVAPFTVRRG